MKTRKITTIEELNEFNLFMKKFWAAYPNANSSEETLALYNDDLSELPMEDLQEAFKILRRKSIYVPAIAELYNEVEAIQKRQLKQKLLASSNEPTLAEMMQWKREPIPDDIAAQLPGWKSLLKKMSMSQRVTEIAGEEYDN